MSMADSESVREFDALTNAVLGVLCHADAKGWGRAPQLYALVRQPSLVSVGQPSRTGLMHEPEGGLVPYEQDPLPEGEPADVLATIHWPEEVEGCVLVTELVVLPPGAADDAPRDQAAAEQWAEGRADRRKARLAVGVLRGGQYTCCLQLRGKDELLVSTDLADDLVAALLGTF